MEVTFDAIGIKIENETAFNALAVDVDKRGEITRLPRLGGILHGRCLKLGKGLEIWSMLYEPSGSGKMSYTDCRPGFRARYAHEITPWVLTEFDEDGEAVIHGFIGGDGAEVLFQLQNLTEVGTRIYEQKSIRVGLCGLAYGARVLKKSERPAWTAYDEIALNIAGSENDWRLSGEILAFEALRNPFTGDALFWIHVDAGVLKLEVLVNSKALQGGKLKVGASLKADVWLQGHILNEPAQTSLYEGVDWSYNTIDFWKSFKRSN